MIEIVFTDDFRKDFKKLAKKYKSLRSDLQNLVKLLKAKPVQGAHLHKNCYKIRMAISSKNKGKSGGARIIAFVRYYNDRIYLLSIYDKGEKDTITDAELRQLLSDFLANYDDEESEGEDDANEQRNEEDQE